MKTPKLTCDLCGKLVHATTEQPYGLSDGRKYWYLRAHKHPAPADMQTLERCYGTHFLRAIPCAKGAKS